MIKLKPQFKCKECKTPYHYLKYEICSKCRAKTKERVGKIHKKLKKWELGLVAIACDGLAPDKITSLLWKKVTCKICLRRKASLNGDSAK